MKFYRCVFNGGDTANPWADNYPDTVGVNLLYGRGLQLTDKACLLQGLRCCGNTILYKGVVPPRVFGVHVQADIKPIHCACDLCAVVSGIKMANRFDTAFAINEPLPSALYIQS